MTFESVDPTTGRVVRTTSAHTDAEIDASLEAGVEAFAAWRELPVSARAAKLPALAAALREDAESAALLMAEEMGKPLEQGRAEVEKCAWLCEHAAAHAKSWLSPEPVATEALRSGIRFEPLGTLLAIMPWNFPWWQVFRAAVPAIAAGNAVRLKHASNVSGCAAAIERAFHAAGFPPGLFEWLRISSNLAGELIDDPRIHAVTLTGSTEAGRAVGARAGAALKKSVLELGGSDAYVVLEDADVEAAAEACAVSRLINGGQSCIAAKRFLVVEPVRERFEAAFTARMAARTAGDPRTPGVSLGPMARADLRDALHEQVEATVAKGARLLLGGRRPEGPGAFYPPTVLADVRPGMPAFDEETFGPAAAIVPARDEAEAIALANRSAFGLGAAVFTGDPERGERVAARLEAGSCFVNGFVRSDPRLPFGGIKASGYGRELAAFGTREFVNVKTIWIEAPR